jgi:hypothetical protein
MRALKSTLKILLLLGIFFGTIGLFAVGSFAFIPSDPEEAITYSPLFLAGLGLGFALGMALVAFIGERIFE